MGGLNSDDFPFFWNLSSLSGSRESSIQSSSDGLVARERQRLPKNSILGQKQIFFKNPKKFAGPKQKYFQTATDKISSEQLTKLQKIKPFGHSKAPKKKSARYCSFSPSWAELPIYARGRCKKNIKKLTNVSLYVCM